MKVLMMPTLHVGQGTHVGGLSVFPVWTDAPVVSGLDTGRSARVQVAEREASPVVGELVLKNEGAKPALLVGGELFEGGWQHRALNHDILLVPGQQMVASVSCVEAGRWHGGAAQVRRSRRASMMIRSAQTMPDEGGRQKHVWERASRYEGAAIDAALMSAEATPGRRARRFAGSLTKAPIGDDLGADAGAGHAMASRSPYHEIRGLGWNDRLLHATVFNRRHHLMEVA